MKKEYIEPLFEVEKFYFENVLNTTESGTPIEEIVGTGGNSEVDPGEDWDF